MNRDQVKGMTNQATGEIKKQVGKMTGDRTTEIKGQARKTEGKLQEGMGNAKENLRRDDDDLEAQRIERDRLDRR